MWINFIIGCLCFILAFYLLAIMPKMSSQKNFEEFKKWMMIGAERIKNDIV